MPVGLRSRSLKIKTEPEEISSPPRIKRRAQTKVELPEQDENKEEPVRNVEEIRRKNLEDNKAFLEGLLMTKIRDDFKTLTSVLQPTIKKEAKKNGYKYVTISENVPVRRSRRLAHMDINGNKLPSPEESDNEMDTTNQNESVAPTYQRKIQKRIIEISPEEQKELNEKIKMYFGDNNQNIESKKSTFNFTDLEILDQNFLKLTPDRLISMDIHSRSDILAIAGCDRKGTIGLVVKPTDNLNGAWCKINYSFHKEYATCCRFDKLNSNCINSTSFDSTFRTCDITKNVFTEIFKDSQQNGLTAFDYYSLQTFLLSRANGDVLLVDTRANPVSMESFDVTKKRIRTLDINPMQREEFCIAGTDNCVKIWDLRKMTTMKYCLETGYSCYGAYYSQSGSHIMATTRDDKVISFSSSDIQNANDPLNIPPTKQIRHRNYVNRFVTPFMAESYSMFDSYFLIGSNDHPREITVIDENCKTICSLRSENLNSLATVNVGHQTLPIIVGGNSSGRIHVFTGQI
ncbi:unnamed protein product [Adineta steineri]|uniref:WD repeat-containing protein 76 n=1 Tax=Adineta steineri TaxID=433720 RepID=A0A818YQ78_9BILA|nr:unnamed protein product [Adineta steineri]